MNSKKVLNKFLLLKTMFILKEWFILHHIDTIEKPIAVSNDISKLFEHHKKNFKGSLLLDNTENPNFRMEDYCNESPMPVGSYYTIEKILSI